MAIGRITGQMLSANLARSGTDLTFETNLLALDVTNSRVGIGTASPATTLHVSATDALRLPSGTTGQRPGSPANGDIRYNSTDTTIEGYANGAWANLASGTQLKDADEDTSVNVEPTSDLDEIHFTTAGSMVGKIAASTIEWGVTSISTSASTIAALTTNGDITLSPNGTGEVNISKVDIDAGAIDGTAIGANSASTGAFTTLTTSGNATIGGDLTVNGTTTTIDSTTLTIEDPLIQLAKNNSGGAANTFDQGLFFNRGSDDNVSLLWDESEDEFAFAVTSGEDGTTAGNVTIDSYANIKAGVVQATDVETATVSASDGTLSMTLANSTGNITTTADIITSDIQTGTVKANDGTGAITITDSTGAVAIATNVSVDGGTFTFNDTGADTDFRFEGDNNANLLFGDAGNDRIGIHTGTPSYVLDIGSSTDAVRLPVGSTAQRPTAATGIIRFNTTTGKYEGSADGSTFVEFATVSSTTPTFTKESATGDGSTTTITGFFSSSPESANNVFVYIDNVYQEPTENYTVSGTNITFTSAPHNGARIFAITGADNTALVTGGVATTESSSVNVSGSSAVTILSFNAASYRALEAFVVSQDGTNTVYTAQKAIVIHDGSTAYISSYGLTNTGSVDQITLSATHDGSNTVNIQATANNSGTHACKVQYRLLA